MAVKMIKPINIRMEKELNERIEDYCWSNRVRVSTFIRQVLEQEMDKKKKINGIGITAQLLKESSIDIISELDLGGKMNGDI